MSGCYKSKRLSLHWHMHNNWQCGSNWITISFSNMSAVLYSNKVSLSLTDIQRAVIPPFIKPLWKQWAVWSQPCHPCQSRGTWEPKTDAVSSLLIWFLVCACRSNMDCTLIEIMQIRQGLIYLIIDFPPLTLFLHLSLCFIVQSDGCVIFSVH